MNRAYAYYEPHSLSSISGMEALAIFAIFALIIVAIIWVLGGFDGPEFPKPGIKGKVDQIFTDEIARANDAGVSAAGDYLRSAQSKVLDQLKKAGAI